MNIRSLILLTAVATLSAAAAENTQTHTSPVTVNVPEGAQQLDLNIKNSDIPYYKLPEFEQKEAVNYQAQKYADRTGCGYVTLMGHAICEFMVSDIAKNPKHTWLGTSAIPLMHAARWIFLAAAAAYFGQNLIDQSTTEEFTEKQKDSVLTSKIASFAGLLATGAVIFEKVRADR